jgi:hypothetical protein
MHIIQRIKLNKECANLYYLIQTINNQTNRQFSC